MPLTIHGRSLVVDETTRERVERRLGFALGRYGERVGKVDVHLPDVNGPRGGVDKRCRIVVEVLGHGVVVVQDDDSNLNALIDRVASRVGQAVSRRIDRVRLYADLLDPRAAGRN